MTDYNIMKIRDYDEVYQLWKKSAGVGIRSLDDSREGIERFLRRNPETCFVAREAGKLIGVILCGHDGRRGYIYHLAVHPDHRRGGIGKSLVDAALEALKKEKINKVALVVFASNTGGNEFWRSVGFVKRHDLVYRNMDLNRENQ